MNKQLIALPDAEVKSKLLFISLFVIAAGLVLVVIGSVLGNMWARYTPMNDIGFLMLWTGLGVLIFGAFALVIAIIKIRFKVKSKLLFISLFVIAAGLVLVVIGSVLGNMWARYTPMNDIGFLMLWTGFGVLIFGAFALVTAIIRRRLQPKKQKLSDSQRLMIICEPSQIAADGISKSILTLQTVDAEGNPKTVVADTQIRIYSERGTIKNPTVIIPKGESSERTVIVSSRECGEVPVTAEAEGLKSVTITLNFTEKKRYCMHCGLPMPLKAKTCSKCGKAPPAGVDTKECHNCKAVIPTVAKYCSECGTGQ